MTFARDLVFLVLKRLFSSDQIMRLTLPLSDYIYFKNQVAETWQ